MPDIWLIRHGQTPGNKLGRYIGITDEPLSDEGIRLLQQESYPQPELVFVSPLRRCTQTAEILFPGKRLHIIEDLAECNFGDFENKNYKELSGNPDYQAWIDSGGTLPFPNGESREEFRRRSIRGFQRAVTACIRQNAATMSLVVHGGTIMNIMEEYAVPHRPFYDWHVGNGGGYQVSLDAALWQTGRCILNITD